VASVVKKMAFQVRILKNVVKEVASVVKKVAFQVRIPKNMVKKVASYVKKVASKAETVVPSPTLQLLGHARILQIGAGLGW
jgi:hypothetical protein